MIKRPPQRFIRKWLPVLVVVALGLFLAGRLLKDPMNVPTFGDDPDGRQQLSFLYIIHDAVWNHGEYPLWNPYFGGGVPWSGYLYNSGLTAISPFAILFGPIIGFKLWAGMVLVLGGLGMYWTAKCVVGLSPPAAMSAAIFYYASEWYLGQLLSGNFDLMVLYLTPLCIYLAWCLCRGRWEGILLPILFSTAFAQAKYAPFIMGLAAFIMVFFPRRTQIIGRKWVFLAFCAAFVAGILISFPKLLPLLEMTKHDLVNQLDYSIDDQYTGWADLFTYLMGVASNDDLSMSRLIGLPFAVVFMGILAMSATPRRSMPLILLAVLAAMLAQGEESPIRFDVILTRLPIFDTMNSYAKYFSVLILTATCLLAAIFVETLYVYIGRHIRLKWRVVLLVAVMIVLPLLSAGERLLEVIDGLPDSFEEELPVLTEEPFHHVAAEDDIGNLSRYRVINDREDRLPEGDMLAASMNNRGLITWYGNFVFPEHARPKYLIQNGRLNPNPDYRGEVYTISGKRVPVVDFTYNTISLDVPPGGDETIILNFNYDEGWRSDDGQIIGEDGLLAVRIPASDSPVRIDMHYTDSRFREGLVVGIVALLLWLAAFIWYRKALKQGHFVVHGRS